MFSETKKMATLVAVVATLSLGGSVAGWAGTPKNNNKGNYGPILNWCDNTLLQLNQAQGYAQSSYQRENFDLSIEQYRAGLVFAQNSLPGGYLVRPFTERAIRRALNVSNELKNLGASDNEIIQLQTKKAHAQFLDVAYDSIISIARTVDISQYNYYNQCNCNRINNRDYEQSLLNSVARAIELPLEALAYTHRGLVYTFGHEDVYLKALELYAYGAAYDLAQSGFAQAYACTISGLVDLGNRLAATNGQNSCSARYAKQFKLLQGLPSQFALPTPVFFYPTKVDAVRWSYNEALALAGNVRNNCGQGFYFDQFGSDDVDGIYQNGRQNNGTTVNIINSKKVKVRVDNKNEDNDEYETDY